jgi:trimethylamine--corrinoid protein Co-methyltransferase
MTREIESEPTVPGRRRGGRKRTQASRSGTVELPPNSPSIRRNLAHFPILDDEGLSRIEARADELLQEIGMEFRNDPETLAIWRDAGADVSGERVRFERGMLRSIIQASAPRSFMQVARNRQRSVPIGGDDVVFAPAYGPPFVRSLDFDRRYAELKDFRNFVKLAYMSPYLHHSGGVVCEPVDVAVAKRHLDMTYAHIRYSDKPFMGAVTSAERAEDSLAMARLVFGDEFVERNCCLLGLINVNSPLVLDATMLGALKVYARAGQGIIVSPFIIAGAMGPVSIAANLAQALAEGMTGLALAQLVRPGAPVVLGILSTAMDMRSGAPSRGAEPMLTLLGFGQLARRLGVPLRGGGSFSASKVPDAQAGAEASSFMMTSVLAGANLIIHAAGSHENGLCMSYEKFVMDADNLGQMARLLEGIDLSEPEFGLDAYREVGPGAHFLGCAHTLERYQTAFRDSLLADNQSYEQWRDGGSLDAAQRANAAWKQMLEDYQRPRLDRGIDDALQEYVERRKAALPDGVA